MPSRLIDGSWLNAFDEWTLPRSEAPDYMVHWTGLFALAAIAKRKVWFPQELLGGYDVYPNLFLLFVADPGVARKSTTAGFSEVLLTKVGGFPEGESMTFGGDVTSASKLLDKLDNAPDSSVTIISSEFSSLIQATPEQIYEILTDIYDNRMSFDWETWAHDERKIEEPSVNLLAATTPAWLSSQPAAHFLGGGFASRVLFIFGREKRQSKFFYVNVDWAALEELGEKLVHDLRIIAQIKGKFKFDSKKARDYAEEWYQDHDRNRPDDPRMKGYHSRKHVHALKIAMLVSLSERDDRIITTTHWDAALKLLDGIEGDMPSALGSMGDNPMAAQASAIESYIKTKGSTTKGQIAQRFYRDVTLDQLNGILAFLAVQDKIEFQGSGQNPKIHFNS